MSLLLSQNLRNYFHHVVSLQDEVIRSRHLYRHRLYIFKDFLIDFKFNVDLVALYFKLTIAREYEYLDNQELDLLHDFLRNQVKTISMPLISDEKKLRNYWNSMRNLWTILKMIKLSKKIYHCL
ncbi:hypothetical protein TPENAI_20063 [Tenacibaculum litopenaei]